MIKFHGEWNGEFRVIVYFTLSGVMTHILYILVDFQVRGTVPNDS